MLKSSSFVRYLLVLASFSLAGLWISYGLLSEVNLGTGIDELECKRMKRHTSIGLFLGREALDMQPIELWDIDSVAAWPVVNPIITAHHLPSNPDAIGNPVLWTQGNTIYLFFEALSCVSNHRAIIAAESTDQGISWHVLGPVLASHSQGVLRRPSVFMYNDEHYMVVDDTEGPQLFKSIKFPLEWAFQKRLIPAKLHGVSVVADDVNNQWLLFGSLVQPHKPVAAPSGNERHLVYRSDSPLGTWEPLAAADGTPALYHKNGFAGPAFKAGNTVVRLYSTCEGSSFCTIQAFNITTIAGNTEYYEQTSVDFSLGLRPWRQTETWDYNGLKHASVVQLPSSGLWMAAASGSSPLYTPPAINWQIAGLVAVTKVLALVAALLMLSEGIGGFASANKGGTTTTSTLPNSLLPTIKTTTHKTPGSRVMTDVLVDNSCTTPQTMMTTSPTYMNNQGEETVSPRYSGSYMGPTAPLTKRSSAGAAQAAMLQEVGAATAQLLASSNGLTAVTPVSVLNPSNIMVTSPSSKIGRVAKHKGRKRRNAVFAALFMFASMALSATGHHFRQVISPFWQPSYPVLVQGHYSKFTLMVMSYESRMRTLRWYVRHYSTCASVGEIVIVWNKGAPPNPALDFPFAPVPIRIRVEEQNSMNNRYKPDPELRFRAVLSLDDDILMPCADIERAFALWRLDPARLVGFYPRLAEAREPKEDGKLSVGVARYHGEPEAIKRGRYNMILSGAAFIDSETFFPAYWSEAVAPARDLVDQFFNCDDMLMNFVVANATQEQQQQPSGDQLMNTEWLPPIEYVKAQRRLDVSHLTGVGISHDVDKFISTANVCLVKFQRIFQGMPLRTSVFDWSSVNPPHCRHDLDILDCLYHND